MRNPEVRSGTLHRPATGSLPARPPRARLGQLALRWHRVIGLSAALFAGFLALTGLLLMHSDRLGLPQVEVSNRWLLDWYGIRPPPPPAGLAVGEHWVTQFGSRIYVDRQALNGVSGVLLGCVEADGVLQIATDGALTLATPRGDIIESLGAEAGLPAGITAAGQDTAGRLVLKAMDGLFVYDDAVGEFAAAEPNPAPTWQVLRAPPAAISELFAMNWQGRGLPLERVVLDLHAGRFFGPIGILVVNLASLALVLLAVTGVVVWWKRRPRR